MWPPKLAPLWPFCLPEPQFPLCKLGPRGGQGPGLVGRSEGVDWCPAPLPPMTSCGLMPIRCSTWKGPSPDQSPFLQLPRRLVQPSTHPRAAGSRGSAARWRPGLAWERAGVKFWEQTEQRWRRVPGAGRTGPPGHLQGGGGDPAAGLPPQAPGSQGRAVSRARTLQRQLQRP